MNKIIITLSIFTALIGTNFVLADTTTTPTAKPTNYVNNYSGNFPQTTTDPALSPGGTITPEAMPTATDVKPKVETNPKSSLDYSGWVQCDGVVDTKNEPGRKTTCNFENLIVMVNHLINWLFAISIPIIVGLFAYAGFKLMTGSESALKEGKAMLLNAGKGFIIMLTAWFIVTTLLSWILNSEFIQTTSSLIGK